MRTKPSQALTQGIEPTLELVGFPAVFADRLKTVDGENRLVRIPEIAERVAALRLQGPVALAVMTIVFLVPL